MAGNRQNNSRARIVPSLDAGSAQGSRVSKATDVQGTPRKGQKERKEKLQEAQVEQRSNVSSSRGGRSPASSARTTPPRSRQGASPSPKKTPSPRATININVNRPPTALAR